MVDPVNWATLNDLANVQGVSPSALLRSAMELYLFVVSDGKQALEKVREVYPHIRTDDEAIRRIIFDWSTDRSNNGKTAKLDQILQLIQWIVEQHKLVNELMDASPAGKSEY